MRLGRLPHSPSRVAAVRPHVMATTAPAPLSVPVPTWTPSLVQNDVLPSCTIAGLLNSARAWALRHDFDLVNTDPPLLSFYAGLAGCADTVAAIEATDGLVLLDVLEKAQSAGFDIGEQTPIVPEFAAIHQPDIAGLRDAVAFRGAAYIGVTLFECDMTGAPWTGKPTGAAVGGHCIDLCAYTPDGFTAATWGAFQPLDNDWLMSRIDEAFSVMWTFPV